tara:strand:- start:280 stop:507 length:228 start_codon:yes stop_codon:yes gene_type:complete
MKYVILVKGWGDDEDRYYYANSGDNIEQLKTDTFQDFDMEVDYVIVTESVYNDYGTKTYFRSVIEEGVLNQGVYA